MPKYTWDGPEQELDFCVVVSTLTVKEIEDRLADLERRASGSLIWKDYVEGGQFEDQWTARKIWDGEVSSNWVVMRDGRMDHSFCPAQSIDAKIKQFVAAKLERVEELCSQPGTEVVEGPARFSGDKTKYTGECVCTTLARPMTSPSFDWQRATNGRFPEHCFECSCGRKWWRYNPDKGLWGPVVDPDAWAMFCEYNGVARYSISSLEEGFYLLQTLRDKGMIPIG